MTTRRPIPTRRPHEVIEFWHERVLFKGSVSYVNNEPVEIFLDGGRPGTPLQAATRDVAVAASLALQHGVSIKTLRHALTRDGSGNGAGPLGALLDEVARS